MNDAKANHLARLRELERRLIAAQTADAEDNILKLIEAENSRWAAMQRDAAPQ